MSIGKDKWYHFTACMVITFVVTLAFFLFDDSFIRAEIAGALCAGVAAVTKEFCDTLNPNNKWDWQDIYADIAGIIGGLFFGSLLFI